MSIEVRSPHNGELMKIMPKDVGRAVKDSDGRVFYVLEDGEGGYYPSITRTATGSAKDQARHERTEARMADHQDAARSRDAAMPRRKRSKPYLLYLIRVGVLVVGGWAVIYGPLHRYVLGE